MGLIVVLLDQRATVHSVQLGADLATAGPLLSQTLAAISRGLVGHGLPPALAGRAADAVLGGMVARESMVLAFRDLFLLTAVVGAALAALGLCLPRPARRPRSAAPAAGALPAAAPAPVPFR